ncbi:MAG: glycosyltransferase [Candidatus Omnitrophica bacterium]|nr:glycosyltransferase [Candidatus Omnitrophota bacterium]
MAEPLVSICVPTYNRAAALAKSLPAILGQDYGALEILISDNGSEDGTEELCRRVQAQDPRVRYYRQPGNIGLYGNHNFCINESRGEFLCFFHDHDERSRHLVSEYVSFAKRHPEVGVICSDWDLIDEAGKEIGIREYSVEAVTPGLEYIDQTLRSGRSSVRESEPLLRRPPRPLALPFQAGGPLEERHPAVPLLGARLRGGALLPEEQAQLRQRVESPDRFRDPGLSAQPRGLSACPGAAAVLPDRGPPTGGLPCGESPHPAGPDPSPRLGHLPSFHLPDPSGAGVRERHVPVRIDRLRLLHRLGFQLAGPPGDHVRLCRPGEHGPVRREHRDPAPPLEGSPPPRRADRQLEAPRRRDPPD